MCSRVSAFIRAVAGAAIVLSPGARGGAQVAAAAPDTAGTQVMIPMTVTGRSDDLSGVATSASEGHVGAAELKVRPIMREGEILETVPGLIVTQHSGDGKANQYFVRGFNLDHGTDFQTSIEGMPLNMPTHAHGQGYTDLNFLIPELVSYIDYHLGVYHAEMGDFASAGGAAINLARTLPRGFATVTGGEHAMVRLAAGRSTTVRGGDLLFAGEGKTYDGPWQLGEKLRKVSAIGRYTRGSAGNELSLLAMAYHNTWNSTDQIPQRAVTAGDLDRFGAIDSTDGGQTERYSLSASWRRLSGATLSEGHLYSVYSDVSLFSNFGYFLADTTGGDQFNQREHRVILGGDLKRTSQRTVLGAEQVVTLGLQTRLDLIEGVGLYSTIARQRAGTVRRDDVREWATGVYAEVESKWHPRFRTVVGARADGYTFKVDGDRPENAGSHTAAIASPKLSLIFVPSSNSELYVSGGLGFHSNDARGTTITIDPVTGDPAAQVDPLVRSKGAEIGLRVNPASEWRTTLSLWALSLNSELLFVGDGGTTEPSAGSRRSGITFANFYRPIPSLAFDADVSFASAKFTEAPSAEDYIPGALERVVAAGVTWTSAERGPFGSIRVRDFGAYPLIEDNSVRATPTTLVNGDVGYQFSRLRLQLTVLNLANRAADDIQYYYTSRLPGEPDGGVDDVHFHPVEPRQLRLSVGWGL